MRVIAGTFRSRLLVSPAGQATRPTSDRLRETLFNILGTRVADCRFVDCYAGTGAVGIEALSRGAEHVYFGENAAAALKALRTNLLALKITGGYTLEERGCAALLERLASLKQGADLVYVDPPYEAEKEYTETLGWLGGSAGSKLLRKDAVVIVEHASKGRFVLAERYGHLGRTRVVRQGDSSLSFYAVARASLGQAT